jgi:hypothetical protein
MAAAEEASTLLNGKTLDELIKLYVMTNYVVDVETEEPDLPSQYTSLVDFFDCMRERYCNGLEICLMLKIRQLMLELKSSIFELIFVNEKASDSDFSERKKLEAIKAEVTCSAHKFSTHNEFMQALNDLGKKLQDIKRNAIERELSFSVEQSRLSSIKSAEEFRIIKFIEAGKDAEFSELEGIYTRLTDLLMPGKDFLIGICYCGHKPMIPKSVPVKNKCANCFARNDVGVKFKACGRCRYVRYCSVECKDQHWKEVHKYFCRAF